MNTPFHLHLSKLYLLLFAAIGCFNVAEALPTDAEQDLLLESQTLEYNEPTGTITYSGDVLMQQGSMKIAAERVVIHGNAEHATKVVATGKPAHFQQTPKPGDQPVQARANELEYMVSTKSLLLKGDAALNQDGTSLSGNRIEYDVQRSVVKASSLQDSGNSRQRVKMIIPPKLLETGPD